VLTIGDKFAAVCFFRQGGAYLWLFPISS